MFSRSCKSISIHEGIYYIYTLPTSFSIGHTHIMGGRARALAPLISVVSFVCIVGLFCLPYGQLKRSNRSYTFPKTFSFELRFWHNFVPDMHDSSEK